MCLIFFLQLPSCLEWNLNYWNSDIEKKLVNTWMFSCRNFHLPIALQRDTRKEQFPAPNQYTVSQLLENYFWKVWIKIFQLNVSHLLCFLWHRLVKLLVEFFMTTMLQLVLLFDQSKSETSNTPHVKFCADMAAGIMFYFL